MKRPCHLHDYIGERRWRLLPVYRSHDPLRRRQVDHIDRAIKVGDLIAKGEGLLDSRWWLVVANTRLERTKKRTWWRATLEAVAMPVTVAGVTYHSRRAALPLAEAERRAKQ